MSTTIIPGIAPVKRVPAKVIVEMSLHDALVYACLEGGTATYDSITSAGLFVALSNHPRYDAYKKVRIAAERAGSLADFSVLREETERLNG